ncbi:MAG: autotransporter-associated beta strand repeat-containing protein [Planctomycetia bacterium]
MVPGTAAGDVVSITGTNINATRTVTINTNVTLGTLNIGDTDASNSYVLALSSGSFTLNNSGAGAQINQTATSAGDTISAPFVLADNLTITNNALTNAVAPLRILTISGNISETGGARTLGKSGTATVVLSGTATYTGTTTINAGILQFAKTASLYNSSTTSWTAANIVTGSGGTLGLNVGGTGEFTTGNVTTLLTNLGGLGGSITNNGLRAGSAIGFDTTNATGAVTIADTIRNSTGTGGGAIGVTKLGSGTMTLSGVSATAANNYSGATTIDRGTLVLADGANLSGGLVFGAVVGGTSTGALDLTSGSATFTSLNVQTDSSGTNTITIGNGKTLTVNGNVQVGYNGGAGSAGNGTSKLTVTGSSAGSDGTWNVTSSNGTFRVGDSSSSGGTGRSGSAILDMSGLNSFTADLRTGASGSAGGTFVVGGVSGGANGANGSTATLAVNSTIKANALTISNVNGNGNAVSLRLGSGNQVINANSISMSQGTRDPSSLLFNTVSGSLTVRGAGGSGRANLTMLTGITTGSPITSTFDVTGHQADLLLGAVKVLDSTAATTSSANNYSAFFGFDQGTLDATSFLIGSKSAGTLSNVLSSTVSLGSSSNSLASATLGTVTIANMTSGTTVSGTLNGTLNIAGNATSVSMTSLTVANYTSGSTAATANGLVSISGGTTTITNGITLANRATAGTTNGTLSITGGSLSVGTAGVSGTNGIFTTGAGGVGTSTLTLDGGSLNLNGNSIGGAGQLITASFLSGTLSNVGGINNGAGLTKTGAGTLSLSGSNGYSGDTRVAAGTLTIAGSLGLAGSTLNMNNADSGTATFAQNSTLAGLSGSRNLDLGGFTISIGNNNTSTTYAGVLSNGAVTKIGTGTFTLSGVSATAAANYAGTTTIDQGTLALSTTGSFSGGLVFGVTNTGTTVGSLDLTAASAGFAGGLTVQDNSTSSNMITLGAGRTLTTSGTVAIGNTTGLGANPTTKLTVAGSTSADGTWTHTASNGVFRVGNLDGSATRAANSTLDLGGLATFTVDLRTSGSNTGGSFVVGDAANASNGSGATVSLAANSTITTAFLGIRSDHPSNGGGGTNSLRLGSGAQILNATTITVGNNQRATNSMSFSGSTGTLQIRAADGTGAATLSIAAQTSIKGSAGTYASTVDLSGHLADLKLSTVTIGQVGTSNVTTASTYVGTLTFDSGTMTATTVNVGHVTTTGGTAAGTGAVGVLNIGSTSNLANTATITTLDIAKQATSNAFTTASGTVNIAGANTVVNLTNVTVASSSNTGAAATGILNIGGGATTVANGITLAGRSGTPGTVSGALNVTGGSLTVGGNITTTGSGGTATTSLTLGGGTLDLGGFAIGGSGQLISTLGFNSGTLRNVGGINDGVGLTKSTAGTLVLAGVNTYSGGTRIDAGKLVANGSVAGNVTVASGATLGGSGSFSGVLSGDGQIGPGNSPGILTVDSLQPTAATSFAFELSGTGSPNWTNAAGSVNDVLRLTNASSPFAGALAGTNVVNVYLGVTSLSVNDTFLGGFFTDKSSSFESSISAATYNFFVLGSGSGTAATYNGQAYYALDTWAAANVPGYTGVAVSTVSVPTANFASGSVINGQVTQFVIVPEPSAIVAAGFGIAMAGWSLWKRRRLA